MAYKYVAISEDNSLVEGTMKAPAKGMAEESLNMAGYRLISIKEVSDVPKIEQLFPSMFSIKRQEVIAFASQLATMLDSGVRIVGALQLLERQIRSKPFKRVVTQVLDEVGTGVSLADALDKHPTIFPDVFRRMVRVGERTGELETVLRQGTSYLEKQSATGKKIKKALMYPAVLLGVSILVITVLVTIALPPVINMLSDLDVDLPLTTRILTGFIGFTGAYPLHILGTVGVTSAAAIFYFKRPQGQRYLQQFLLRVPLIGKTILAAEIARFARTVSMLTAAGLPLPETIAIARESTKNWQMQGALTEVEDGLMNGEGLAVPMMRQSIFPPMLVQMVKVAEETGNLELSLSAIADHYDLEADETSGALISIIEPAVTLGVAVIVAFIALSVIMPMYQMIGSME